MLPFHESFLHELDREVQATRKVIERIPEAKLDWRPHATSMSAGELASHIVEMYAWANLTLKMDEFDLIPVDGPRVEPYRGKTVAEIVARLEQNYQTARDAIRAMTQEEAWAQHWALKSAGNTMISMPRSECVRVMVLNHIVHHRGQLSVYLRILGIPVPAIYGPSGDER